MQRADKTLRTCPDHIHAGHIVIALVSRPVTQVSLHVTSMWSVTLPYFRRTAHVRPTQNELLHPSHNLSLYSLCGCISGSCSASRTDAKVGDSWRKIHNKHHCRVYPYAFRTPILWTVKSVLRCNILPLSSGWWNNFYVYARHVGRGSVVGIATD